MGKLFSRQHAGSKAGFSRAAKVAAWGGAEGGENSLCSTAEVGICVREQCEKRPRYLVLWLCSFPFYSLYSHFGLKPPTLFNFGPPVGPPF